MCRFKVDFVWWPKKLAIKNKEEMRFVGWVWMQKAYLVNNLNHGWIAFVDQQTEEYLSVCPCCNKPFKVDV